MAKKTKKEKGEKSPFAAMILDPDAPDSIWRHALCGLAVQCTGRLLDLLFCKLVAG